MNTLELKNKTNAINAEFEKLFPTDLNTDIANATNKVKPDGVTFSEAIEKTKFGIFNIILNFVSGMVLGNVLLETAAISFVLPIAECDLNLTNEDKGILSSIGYVGIIVSSHLWGFLADTKGRRKVIRPTLLVGFVVTLFSSFSPNMWTLVILRFINGFFVSGGSATIYAYLGEFYTDKTRSRAMMGSSVVYAIGALIMPILAFLVINRDWILPLPFIGIDYKPWRLFFIVCGIPGFLCGLSMYFLPESPKFLLTLHKEEEAIAVIEKMARWNRIKEPLEITHIYPEEDALETELSNITANDKDSNFIIVFVHTMWNQTIPLFHKKFLRITLIVCIAQFWLYVVTNGFYMWFPHIINSLSAFTSANPGQHKYICEIVNDKSFLNTTETAEPHCITKLEHQTYIYSTVMEILYVASFALIGLIINLAGEITVLFITTIFFTSCGLAAIFIADPNISSYLYISFFLVGVGTNILGAATVEVYPTQLRAMAICISLMAGRLGSVVGANILGALLESYCEITFYISCAALLGCAFLILLLPKKSKIAAKETINPSTGGE